MIPLVSNPSAFGALDDVDSGSPHEYTVDSQPPTQEEPDGHNA